MNKFKKAISVALTTTLLASLFTVIAASSVMAAVTVTSAGTIPRGGESTGTATFVFTENSIAAFGAGGTLTVTILDSASGATVHFTGTPTLTAPGSLGASLAVGDNSFTITSTNSDATNVEQITVAGLGIEADIGAATGAIKATLTGTYAAAVTPATVTASGILQAILPIGATVGVAVNVTSACNFVTSGTTVNFSDASDARTVTVAGGATQTGIQNIDFGAGTVAHPIGTVVTQTVPNCNAAALASPGTVADVVVQDVPDGATLVQPGEFNQPAANTTVTEQTAGYIADNTVLTFTLSVGVFSTSPVAWVSTGDLELNGDSVGLSTAPCNLSFDRKSCTVTVTDPSTVASTITLGDENDVVGVGTGAADPILLDIAAGVAAATDVDVTVTGLPVILVSVDAQTIAVVGRVVVAIGAQPTIYIGENDQPSGQITITESAAGFFTAGTGANNAFAVCIFTGETFTRAPYAVVTAGNLQLLSGLVGGTSVLGILYTDPSGASCARWTVYSKSTTASTIEIRGSDVANAVLPSGANNGPRLSVPNGLPPGTTQSEVLIGSQANILLGTTGPALATLVSNAVRAFRNQPVVAAVSQPNVPKGSTNALAGCLTITETQAGQFKAGETITVTILPRSSTTAPTGRQDIFLKTGVTADLPTVATNTASGLLASLIGNSTTTFTVGVNQQATGTLGVITLCNIRLVTLADAVNGAVLVRVQSAGAGVTIDQVVSIGTVGAVSVAEATINRGLNTRSGFGFATETVARGSYVTIRSRASGSAPGDLVQIWVKTKTTAWKLETTRRVSPNGFMYYSGKVLNSGYRYYRVLYVTQGSISNTVRAYGR